MADFKNNFRWSKTRDGVFRECLRKYYYTYYGFWNGWLSDADPATRTLYVLKQIKTRQMWAGERVHECIARALKNARSGIDPMHEGAAINATLAMMRNDYTSSRQGNYWQHPKSCALFEHEYEIVVADEEWKANADHAVHCLHNFYRSETWSMIHGLARDQWLEIEEFGDFTIEGTKVVVKLDFCYRDGDDIVIIDWKTGRSDIESSDLQLACYGQYAVHKWDVSPDQVRTIEVNLAKNTANERRLSPEDVETASSYIRGSTRDMLMLLDVREGNVASEDKFPLTDDEGHCRRCNFKKVCPKFNPE